MPLGDDGLAATAPNPVEVTDTATMTAIINTLIFGEPYAAMEDSVSTGSTTGASAGECLVSNNSGNSVNLRMGPGSQRGIAGLFPSGETLPADGRNRGGDWVRVERQGTQGWVFLPLVEIDCDAMDLPVEQ